MGKKNLGIISMEGQGHIFMFDLFFMDALNSIYMS